MPNKISKAARLLSARGASKGGKARAKALSPERRKEISQLAVKTRWTKARRINGSLFIQIPVHMKFKGKTISCVNYDDRNPVVLDSAGRLIGKIRGLTNDDDGNVTVLLTLHNSFLNPQP